MNRLPISQIPGQSPFNPPLPPSGEADGPHMSLVPPSTTTSAPPRPEAPSPLFAMMTPGGYREQERAKQATLATYQIVTNNDVMSLQEVANNFTKGNEYLARQMLNDEGAPEQYGEGLFLAESVIDFFNSKPPVEGSVAYARRAMSWSEPKPRGKFSLMVENAPERSKVTITEAAARYFKNNELAAHAHLRDKGLHNVHDTSGRYLEKHFR